MDESKVHRMTTDTLILQPATIIIQQALDTMREGCIKFLNIFIKGGTVPNLLQRSPKLVQGAWWLIHLLDSSFKLCPRIFDRINVGRF